jgi:hypothetical protein
MPNPSRGPTLAERYRAEQDRIERERLRQMAEAQRVIDDERVARAAKRAALPWYKRMFTS